MLAVSVSGSDCMAHTYGLLLPRHFGSKSVITSKEIVKCCITIRSVLSSNSNLG